MKRTIIAFGCLTGPALAQSVGEKSGVNSTLGISPTTADFVKEVAVSDMFEIQSNKLAENNGNTQEKAFAAQMVNDHTKTSMEPKGLVSSGKVKEELLTALDSSHQRKLDKLKGESGKDFSSDFNAMQVSAHKDAVSLFERYEGRRQFRFEGLGRKDSPGPSPPSRNGGEARQTGHRKAACHSPGRFFSL